MDGVKRVKKQKLKKSGQKVRSVEDIKDIEEPEEVEDVEEIEDAEDIEDVEELDESEQAEEIDEDDETEEPDKSEGPKAKTKKKEKKKEKEEKEEKSSKKGWVALVLALVVLLGGGYVAKMFLTKTTVDTEKVKLADDARGISNYFKEYLLDRVKAEDLFKYNASKYTNEEVLTKLTDLKDGFSKVSRGVTGNYASSEYKELAEVMEADASMYLTAVRELRSIMTAGFSSEGERREAFTKKIEESTKELRSALYVATSAFDGDVPGFSSKGALIFDGPVIVEVGGGVMNILLGDFDEKLTAVSMDRIGEDVKLIDAAKLYGYASTRLVNLGVSLNGEMESGWVKYVEADVSRTEVELTKTRISTVMKNVWNMNEELEGQGIKGLIGAEEKAMADELNEVVKGLTGK